MARKTQKKVMQNLVLENCRIGFRNFSGKETKFNREGNRNFVVFLDDPDVWDQNAIEDLEANGWNVRFLDPREADDSPIPYLPVALSYNNFPPKVILVTTRGQTHLDEDMVGMLDWSDILNVDLIVRPYNWEVNGKTGVKAYVKTMYVTIEEDEFADKYRQSDDAGTDDPDAFD